MKKLVAILAFVGVLLQTLSQVVIVAQYYANKDYIAKNLCENRNKPKMHCDGKCCLKKKLAKDGKDATAPANPKSENAITLFYSDNRIEITAVSIQSTPNHYFNGDDLRTFSFHSPVFHPPGA